MSDTKSEANIEGGTMMYVEKFFYDELATANKELRAKHERVLQMLEVAEAAIERAIPEFQWVTNGIKMNETQHIRLGDAICLLHDSLAQIQELKK